uniref:Dynactin domain-containing protein n=1 Tax=Ascaris lumbricoides TaxID=6252 RepID=A0A0M3IQ30_ASCLU
MNREQEYVARITALELELKNTQQELDRYRSDLERLQTLHTNASETALDLDTQKKHLKEELRELKLREQRLLSDYSELEEENIGLQKQVSNLRSAQVEFEAMKMEVKRLLDETDQLQADKEEANKLTIVAQKHLESSFIAENNDFGKMPPKGADLFSEIHGDMHGRIAELEAKNDQLALSLKDAERDISFVVPVLKKLEVMSTPELDHSQLKQLCDDALTKIEQLTESTSKVGLGGKQLDILKADLRTAILAAGANNAKVAAAQDLMIAVADFLYRLYHQLVSTHGLGADKNAAEVMKKLRQFAKDNAESEEMAQCNDLMIAVADFLYRLYHQLVSTHGLGADKNAAEVMKKLRQFAKDNAESEEMAQSVDEGVESGTETESGRSPRIMLNLQRHVISANFAKAMNEQLGGDRVEDIVTESDLRERIVPADSDVFKVSDCLTELSKIVRRTVENALNARVENEDQQELTLQNMKLRSLLATKR